MALLHGKRLFAPRSRYLALIGSLLTAGVCIALWYGLDRDLPGIPLSGSTVLLLLHAVTAAVWVKRLHVVPARSVSRLMTAAGAVNLSARQFQQSNLTETVADVLATGRSLSSVVNA